MISRDSRVFVGFTWRHSLGIKATQRSGGGRRAENKLNIELGRFKRAKARRGNSSSLDFQYFMSQHGNATERKSAWKGAKDPHSASCTVMCDSLLCSNKIEFLACRRDSSRGSSHAETLNFELQPFHPFRRRYLMPHSWIRHNSLPK